MTRRTLGSIRNLGGGRYRIVVSAGWDTVAHKRRRIDRTFSGTKRQAEAELSRILLEVGKVSVTDISVETYLVKFWLPHKKTTVRLSTWTGYEIYVRKKIVPLIGQIPLSELDPLAIDRWLERLSTAGVKGHSALHAYRVLHAALKYAVTRRILAYNPLDAVAAPSPADYEYSVLSAAEAVSLLRASSSTILEPMIALALGTGMRRSEMCGLKWSDVDLEGGSVRVVRGRHQLTGKILEEPPKTKRSRRVISLPDYAIAMLQRHRQKTGYVISDEQGAPITPQSLYWRYKKFCKDTPGVRYVPIRNLRHTHATLALESGADVVAVSRRLGHSTVTTTDSFYLQPSRGFDVAASDGLNDSLMAGLDKKTREQFAPTRAKPEVTHVKRPRKKGKN